MSNVTGKIFDTNDSFQSSYYWLIVSVLCSIVWIVYLTYYNSRVVGLFLTLAINRFTKYGYLKIGSFSISVLSGKIMFRDIIWITEDYSVRLKLGYAIFRWWQPLIKKDFNEDLSHSDTRLSIYLENVECHIYNYSSNFSKLEKIFGLDQNIIPPDKIVPLPAENPTKKDSIVLLNKKKWQWRDLIPVIKLDISNSRIIFGNYMMPQSLMITSREMRMVYTTKPASTPFDLFMHIIKCRADNFKVMLVPSPKYTGKADEPPRCMGEGFAMVRSSSVEIYYYQDEPGLVPYEPESVYLANGDVISIRTWPCWGMDVKCGKNTDFSYGPWCERQREFLYKFFLPASYEALKADELPQPGQLRVCRSFDFKMSMQNDVTFDLLFTKQTETQAIHMNCKQGSYLEFTIPWFLDEPHYVFTITGQLMHVDASTSLMFRNLIECETLEFSAQMKYPTYWNDFQNLVYDLTACKATVYILYQHKTFFSDLFDDWASKTHPDIYAFIPYNIQLNLIIKEFEAVVLTNEWNWIDCFGTSTENAHLAVTGDMFDLTLQLPFDDYLPDTVSSKLFIRGESAEGFIYLPETYSSRHMLIAMSDHLKLLSRDGIIVNDSTTGTHKNVTTESKDKKWHRLCLKQNGWVDVVTFPIVALSLVYTYHPMPMLYTGKELGSFNVDEIDAEESILVPFKLVPMRPLRSQVPLKKKGKYQSPAKSKFKESFDENEFDASELEPDIISVELEFGPSVLKAYGSVIACALEFKENYLGSYQSFTDLSKNVEFSKLPTTSNDNPPKKTSLLEDLTGRGRAVPSDDPFKKTNEPEHFDPRMYRPFNLMLHLTLHDVQGHLVKHCTDNGPPCPSVFMERMVVEVDKQYHETKLQVLFSPIIIVCKDNFDRLEQHSHLQTGYLTLSALQIRGHAMFSHKGLPIDSETLEYAWLMELTLGDFVGRLTASQLQSIVESLQAFVVMVSDKENKLVRPQEYPSCQHMVPQPECKKSTFNKLHPCPTVMDLKYEFVRLSVDCIDFYMVEAGSALSLQVIPIRLAKCNLFNTKTMEGLTVLLPKISLKHYVSTQPINSPLEDLKYENMSWLETGSLKLGPIHIDLSKTLLDPLLLDAQQEFLRFHDHRHQRLHFLWGAQMCGCVGGCAFFGNNRNGSKFFDPSPDDYTESINVAIPYITDFIDKSITYGYGQSLLRTSEFVFCQNCLSAADYLHEIFAIVSRDKLLFLDNSEFEKLISMKDLFNKGKNTFKNDFIANQDFLIESKPSPIKEVYLSSQVKKSMKQFDRFSVNDPPVSLKKSNFLQFSTGSLPTTQLLDTNYLEKHSSRETLLDDEEEEEKEEQLKEKVVSTLNVSSRLGSKLNLMFHQNYSKQKDEVMSGKQFDNHSPRTLDSQQYIEDTTAQQEHPKNIMTDIGMKVHSMIDKLHLPTTTHFFSKEKSKWQSEKELNTNDQQPSTSNSPDLVGHRLVSTRSKASIYETAEQIMEDGTSHTSSESFVSAARDFENTDFGNAMPDTYSTADSRNKQIFSGEFLDGSQPSSLGSPPRHVKSLINPPYSTTAATSDVNKQVPIPPSHLEFHPQLKPPPLPPVLPITDCPILMECYKCYMSQMLCYNWHSNTPLSTVINIDQLQPNMESMSGTSNINILNLDSCVPYFIYESRGFDCDSIAQFKKIVGPEDENIVKDDKKNDFEIKKKFGHFSFSSGSLTSIKSDIKSEVTVNDWVAVIKTTQSLNIMMSPIMMEALQRYIESATPYLCSMHPSTIVDMLHMKCLNTVLDQEDKNTTLPSCLSDWGDNNETTSTNIDKLQLNKIQLHVQLPQINIFMLQVCLLDESVLTESTPKKEGKTLKKTEIKMSKVVPPTTKPTGISSYGSTLQTDDSPAVPDKATQLDNTTHKEYDYKTLRSSKGTFLTMASRLRTKSFDPLKSEAGSMKSHKSKKNSIKASEMTSISLFAICFNKVQLQLLNTAEIKTTTTILMSNTDSVKNKKSGQIDPSDLNIMSIASIGNKIGVGRKKTQDEYRKLIKKTNISTVKCKSFSEARKSNSVIQMDIDQLHLQLRRSKNLSGSMADPYSLTAIPQMSSKVFFKFESELRDCSPSSSQMDIPYSWDIYNMNTGKEGPQSKPCKDKEEVEVGDVINLLMFECGFENIKFTSANRTGYLEKANLQTTQQDRSKYFQLIDKNQPLPSATVSTADDSSVQNTVTKNASCFGVTKVLTKSVKPHQTNVEIVKDKNDHAEVKFTVAPAESKELDKSNNSLMNKDDPPTTEHVSNVTTTVNTTTATAYLSNASDLNKTIHQTKDHKQKNESGPKDTEVDMKSKKLTSDASSFGLQIKTVWFNFAAPPASSKEMKYLANKNDWNLLSTATPSINAWMNPCHKAVKSAQLMFTQFNRRMHSVMACLMTGALDVQAIHLMPKSKYNKTTWESKFLQDDPSCQLVTVIRKYIHTVGIDIIEESLKEEVMPQNIIIKNGIMILIRQWKNVLYLPMFDDNTYKAKKKVTVTFALPVMDEQEQEQEQQYEHLQCPNEPKNVSANAMNSSEDVEINLDNLDIIDENTSLLKAEGGSVQKIKLQSASDLDFNNHHHNQHHSPRMQSIRAAFLDDHKKQQNFRKIESSSHFQSAESMTPQRDDILFNNNISNLTLNSGCSSDHVIITNNTADSNNIKSQQSANAVYFLPTSNSKSQQRYDLNEWMNKQQEYINNHNIFQQRSLDTNPGILEQQYYNQKHFDQRKQQSDQRQNYWPFTSKLNFANKNTGSSDMSKDSKVQFQASSTFQLIDAQVLFKPLLEAMGLDMKAIKMSSVMEKFGGELSVLAKLQEIRVDIVDSETTFRSRTLKKRPMPKLLYSRARPAFLCRSFHINLSMVDVFDFEETDHANEATDEEGGKNKGMEIAGDVTARSSDHEPVLLKTVHLLKDTVEQFEVKPTTTKVNFSLTSQSVTQHVNMSLLRLVHQFVTMVESVAKSKSDLQRGTPETFSTPPSAGVNETTSPFPTLNKPVAPLLSVPKASNTDQVFLKMGPNSTVKRPTDKQLDSVEKGHGPAVNFINTLLDGHDNSVSNSLQHHRSNVAVVRTPTSPSEERKVVVDEIKENTPVCWKTMYHLINLYNNVPDMMKTFERPTISVVEDELKNKTSTVGASPKIARLKKTLFPRSRSLATNKRFTQNILVKEKVPLVVFGSVHIKSFNISAVLSGLKLQTELKNSIASFTHREKIKGVTKRKSTESSAYVSINQTTLTLLEGLQSSMQQTVVSVNVSQTSGLFSSFIKKVTNNSFCLASVGVISVNIPQHPVALHTMVVHSSKRLSNTLQEFIKMPNKYPNPKAPDTVDTPFTATHIQHEPTPSLFPTFPYRSHSITSSVIPQPTDPAYLQSTLNTPVDRFITTKSAKKSRFKLIEVHFKGSLKGLIVGASLLPSLKAQYQMGEVTSFGVAGDHSNFYVHLQEHSLSFSSRVNASSNVPTSASIAMPPIHIQAEYKLDPLDSNPLDTTSNPLIDGLELRHGSYLKATAEVGAFEHVLTTDLLNHLVFVQKVFMKEVNEVVQRVSGADQPVSLWTDNMPPTTSHRKPLLYSFLFRLKSIQITATTPTNNAVRFETGKIEFELSNRVQRSRTRKDQPTSNEFMVQLENRIPKVFFQVKVDLNLALGTLIKNLMFEEAEAEFPHLASFGTSITLRNALQDEIISGASMNQEALLITLKRPIVFVLPSAFDKAILVWLNYRNAYEYWTEQRMALNKEIQQATQQVLTKLPPLALSESSLGVLFLQMTIDDLGICLPINPFSQKGFAVTREDSGLSGALVLTLESAQISACSYGSFVSKGKFTDFCLRFAEDFEVSWDDWKPEKSVQECIMNALVVPNGTFEMCSRTTNTRHMAIEKLIVPSVQQPPQQQQQKKPPQQQQQQQQQSFTKQPPQISQPAANQQPQLNYETSMNAKWILNILWQMKGIDIHLDTNIGKRLNVVWNTLTSLAGEAQINDCVIASQQNIPVKVEQPSRKQSTFSPDDLPDFVYDFSLDPKTRTRLIEKEMNEQAKVVQDLKSLRASHNTIQEEERKLQGLEAALFHDFRQDIMKKFRSHHSNRKTYGENKLSVQSLDKQIIRTTTSLAGIKPHVSNYETLPLPGGPTSQPADADQLPSDVVPRHGISSGGHFRTQSFDVSQLHTTSLGVPPTTRQPPESQYKHFSRQPDSQKMMVFEEEGSPTSENKVFDLAQLQQDQQQQQQQQQFFNDTLPTFDIQSDDDSKIFDGDDDDYFDDMVDANYDKFDMMTNKKMKNVMSQHNLQQLQQQIVEPAVDFELDIRAEIDSGKCVLHPKEIKTEQTEFENTKGKTTMSWKNSPKPVDRRTRKRTKDGGVLAGVDLIPSQINRITMAQNNNTVFIIPGVDVKLHYNSRTIATQYDPSNKTHSDNMKKYLGFKRANLYAWCSIQKLPEEMLISTSLLDFLEQAIEPIPIEPLKRTAFKLNTPDTDFLVDTGSGSSNTISKAQQPYASFPVEVVVYIRVQPSMVRFTCLPVSRVECLLRIPSLEVVFSTKKIEHNHSSDADFLKEAGSSKQTALILDGAEGTGGLSVSVCMNDFSLYIFHPYGGRQRRTSLYTGINSGINSTINPETSKSSIAASKTTLVNESRKDSLNLNVEFVKVNISRGRKMVQKETSAMKSDKSLVNVVRLSLICDIGSASFKYDMRRLLEILALPKAWYRRTLARRLFLGEEIPVYDSDSESGDDMFGSHISSDTSLVMSEKELDHDNTLSSSSTVPEDLEKIKIQKGKSSLASQKNKSFMKLKTAYPPKHYSTQPPPQSLAIQLSQQPILHGSSMVNITELIGNQPVKTMNPWETLVLFSVNLPRLDVMVNMSNAMGNTVWTTKGLQCRGRLMIDSAGYKNVNMFAGLSGSKLEAKGGIIGGLIELQNVSGQAFVKEVPDKEPQHRIKTSLHTMEMRLDYMGSTILITRISDLLVQLYDEWKLKDMSNENAENSDDIGNQSILVFVHGNLSWDRLHMMISKSTTPDLLKMAHKLEEFFSQQLVSGKRVLSTFGTSSINVKANKKNVVKEEDIPSSSEIKHHRHWQKVFDHLSCCKLSNFTKILPEWGSMVGGSMNLMGKNITLACFHGINFRTKSWALFTMDEPYIMFATDATNIEKSENGKMTHIIQNLTFQLRHNVTDMSIKRRMATVYKLSRGHYMPPPFTSVQEWFHYAFATNDIATKNLDKFPTNASKPPDMEDLRKYQGTGRGRIAEYKHDTEIIFMLPSFQMNLKTVHFQMYQPPSESDKKPVVECSFVTEFDDHIFVAMDAEAVLFLHDLITNYIKEKDKTVITSVSDGRIQKSSAESEKQNDNDASKILNLDSREFDCKTWHLEPTVRLLSWGGKEIDPVGVDYILHKLGFQHARLTIPKWLQRGCMDPLDKILSVLVDRLIVALHEARN